MYLIRNCWCTFHFWNKLIIISNRKIKTECLFKPLVQSYTILDLKRIVISKIKFLF
ncbi:hypothetical protein LEP1GSC034_4508 [Leptospira interrogans str. 2003000735]|uniref:Uncharacterized protein n=2 Tax=Leptospira interrogans TaxID=173 RepID=A0A829CV31_LEPIR|nr:hypothetical protein LEP1GSC027_4868 [Leptospira interrogans str. 2002000624]EKQ36854.1 hypothetical protein LEP1GSC025_4812 [Leptospira interrogans str. 2002000621]EKQ48872.1 hypothetical protein LEP1GSC026_0404 [Leptospira interrogans str. 2002000623]EMJ71834.1 hypothetical protein LEP1GSC033_4137 [Leptospira interrogans str. 2002000632]EMJ74605.1 hypothetical protein LEP1GSC034_4508 [Leptospira interrogans str. 2003000735]EMJ75962.1 hypothetical protein LEP1GSC032_3413 [Leptospira interr